MFLDAGCKWRKGNLDSTQGNDFYHGYDVTFSLAVLYHTEEQICYEIHKHISKCGGSGFFSRLRGFGENVRPFLISVLIFFFFF